MKQVIQDFNTGELFVVDMPIPSIGPRFVLERNQFSLISAGTEMSTVATAQGGVFKQSEARPDVTKQVITA